MQPTTPAPAQPAGRQRTPSASARRHSPRVLRAEGPAIRFSPYAWAKMLYLRDAGPIEVGGLGLCRDGGDPLAVHDVAVLKQVGSRTTTRLDDDAVNDHMLGALEQGLQPCQTMRIWVHTHPGHSAEPSGTDWATFERIFARCDWGVMVILAMDGSTSAHIRLGKPLEAIYRLPVEVDCRLPFAASNPDAWQGLYAAAVTAEEGAWTGPWGLDAWGADDWAVEPEELCGLLEPDGCEGYGPASVHRRQAQWADTLGQLDDDSAQRLLERLEERLEELQQAVAQAQAEGDEALSEELAEARSHLGEQLTALRDELGGRGWMLGGRPGPALTDDEGALEYEL